MDTAVSYQLFESCEGYSHHLPLTGSLVITFLLYCALFVTDRVCEVTEAGTYYEKVNNPNIGSVKNTLTVTKENTYFCTLNN